MEQTLIMLAMFEELNDYHNKTNRTDKDMTNALGMTFDEAIDDCETLEDIIDLLYFIKGVNKGLELK